MRKTTLLFIAMVMASFSVYSKSVSNVTIIGANGIADYTGYTTLKEAFDAINLQGDQTGKNIEIQIAGNTTETASAVLNQPATASWTSLTIYPTVTGVSISGNFIGPLISLNSADRVTITGKLNKVGVSKGLTIEQQETSSSTSSTILLINDAKLNTITHCFLKGSSTASSTVGGIVYFGTALASTGTGNDENVISFNDFTKSTISPAVALGSQGTSSSIVNDKNIIENNNFYGLFSGPTAYGIKLSSQNSEFTIRNNSFYEPIEIAPTEASAYYAIYVTSASGEKFTITNNFIGGSEAQCGGLPMKKKNDFSNIFTGIFISTSSSLSGANEIQGNTIKNIEWKNTSVKKDFTCITSFGNTSNFGTTSSNTISDISLQNGAISGTIFYGYSIGNGSGLFTIKYNTISNITISNSDGVNGSSFYGLYKSGTAGEVNFSDNIINNISITGTSTGSSQILAGAYISGNNAAKITVNKNTISNLSNGSSRTDVSNSVFGVYVNSTAANGSISANKIFNLSAFDATLPARVIGINMDVTSTSSATVCSNNMISLGNSSPGLVYGILQNTGLGKVYHNSVYLAGNPLSGSYESAALNATGSTAGREFLNNILINARSNSGTASSKHYTVKYAATTNLLSDYNVVNYTGIGGLLGAIGATEYATENDWSAPTPTGTGLDTHSKVSTVLFTAPATGDLSLTGTSISNVDLAALRLPTVLTDFSTTNREAITYIGAHEASNLTTVAKYFTVNVPNGTEKVYVAGSFTNKVWDNVAPFQLLPTGTANQFAGILPCVDGVNYKYMCATGDWDYEEGKYNDVNGAAPTKLAANRTYNATDNVILWYNVNKLTFNVSFATNVPNTLFMKGSFDNWTTGVPLTKNGSTYSITQGGNPGEKFAANIEYKYYTNDDVANNWESDASGNGISNRWTVAPVMNDQVARFTTAITTGLDKAIMQAGIQISKSGIYIPVNGTSSIELYTLNGTLVDKAIVNNSYNRALSNGAYIVKINGKAVKFVK